MGLLKFGLLCIDFLAWPMLALAYPLFASIRAIETGSKYQMRKLVIYWTVFSVISLFEHTLQFMEWVPMWPYIKLIGTFWLVIPQFSGACYAYDCLLRANLGAKLHCIVSQFNSPLYAHIHLNKLYLHMQGIKRISNSAKAGEQSQNLSKDDASFPLIQSKDIKAMEQPTKPEKEERKVKIAVGNIGDIREKEIADEKIIPEIKFSKLIQIEWTCAVCQVVTTSENDLKSHLGGMRHRTKCLELKSNHTKQKTEGKQEVQANLFGKVERHAKENNANVSTDSTLYCRTCNIWCPGEAGMASHLKGRKHLSNVKAEKATNLPNQVKNDAQTEGSKQKTNGNLEKVQVNASSIKERNMKENNANVSTDSTQYCRFCNIWCPGEAAMKSHLKGKKHALELKEMAISMANEPAKNAPLGGSKHETNVAGGGSNQITNKRRSRRKSKKLRLAKTEGV